jgi:hypothetical protein
MFLAAGVYLSEAAPSHPMTPYYPPPLIHCIVYTCVQVYLFTGRGGESLSGRRLEEQRFTKPVENANMTDCISSLQTLLTTSKDDI